MKILVLGCTGMAGSLISLYLAEARHQVLGFSRRCVGFIPSVSGDVRDLEKLRVIIKDGNFHTVINAVGILNKNAEENKEAAVFLNGYLPHFLVSITENTDTQIIHMSTDCVFSGKIGAYTEDSFRDGEMFYDRSKAIGELEDCKNLTLRNSIIGPDMNEEGIGLLNWFMKQEGTVNGYTRVMWTGLTTLELAKIIEKAARERAHGLINMVPQSFISKYELLLLFNKYLKGGKLTVNSLDNYVVNKTLVRTNFNFDYDVPGYEKMIDELAVWIKEHKKFYPHYCL